MKRTTLTAILFIVTAIVAHAASISVEVKNPSNFKRTSVPVVISLKEYGTVRSAIVSNNTSNETVTCQLDDLDQDGLMDELCFLVDLSAKEKRTFTVTMSEGYDLASANGSKPATPAGVYVEMLLSNKKVKEENKHDLYISQLTVDRGVNPYNQLHHHGAAFENELVAYRIYFDHRQTVDIYGKYHRQLELRQTQFYPDDTQKKTGFGDDVLWVGNTFGVGTLRGYDGQQPTMLYDVLHRSQRILARGPLRTIVEVTDEGWLPNAPAPSPTEIVDAQLLQMEQRVTLTTRYTLYANRRDCFVEVEVKPTMANQKPTLPRFSTGIINVKESEEFCDHHGLRGCWGNDWPVSAKDSVGHKRETVGLGICLPAENIVGEWPADKDNYGYEISMSYGRKLCYAISFCSDNEDFGYHSATEWFDYLKQWKRELAKAVEIRIKPTPSLPKGGGFE